MKQIILALTCIAAVIMLTACGSKSNKKVDIQEVAGKLDKEKFAGERRSKAASEFYFKKLGGVDLAALLPGFNYTCEPEERSFLGDKHNVAAVFFKTDGELTKEEFKAYVTKVYDATRKASEDGKNIYGFEKKNQKGEAMSELTLEELFANDDKALIYLGMYDWGYRYNGKMLHVYMEFGETNGDPKRWYANVNIAPALEKSFDDTMKEAEKALEREDVQKAIKKALK